MWTIIFQNSFYDYLAERGQWLGSQNNSTNVLGVDDEMATIVTSTAYSPSLFVRNEDLLLLETDRQLYQGWAQVAN